MEIEQQSGLLSNEGEGGRAKSSGRAESGDGQARHGEGADMGAMGQEENSELFAVIKI